MDAGTVGLLSVYEVRGSSHSRDSEPGQRASRGIERRREKMNVGLRSTRFLDAAAPSSRNIIVGTAEFFRFTAIPITGAVQHCMIFARSRAQIIDGVFSSSGHIPLGRLGLESKCECLVGWTWEDASDVQRQADRPPLRPSQLRLRGRALSFHACMP